MATYVNNLRLKEITTGDESGTWGTSTNTNLELIADAFGSGTEAITTNEDTHTTTIADGAADEGRAIFLKYTGTLDSACTITIAPNTVNKLWLIENATSGSQNIIISQGSGANITIGNGKIAAVFTDGAGAGAAVLDAFADLELSSTLTVAGASTLTGAVTAAAGITMTGTTPTLTIGDAGAEDTKIVFDGNAQDYYVGLDDTDDDLKIGLGSTVGTTPAITIDENQNTTITNDLQVSATGPHGFGIAAVDYTSLVVGGAFTSGGATTRAGGLVCRTVLTGAVGDTAILATIGAGNDWGSQIITQGTDTNISVVATMYLSDPDIVNNLASSGKPDYACTLYINDAPTEGDENYALLVHGGAIHTDGTFTANGGSVFNEGSADVDFRVESNGNANMLFVDGGNDRVGIGVGSPDRNLHIETAGDTYVRVSGNRGNTNDLHIGNIEFENTLGSVGVVAEMRAITGNTGTQSTMGQLAFYTDNGSTYAERMRIQQDGKIGMGETAPETLLHIKGGDVRSPDSSATLTLEGAAGSTSNAGMNILSTGTGNILFGDAGNSGIGKITYSHSNNSMNFTTNDSTKLTIDSSGNLQINATAKLYLDGGSDTYIVESSANTVQIATGDTVATTFNSDGTIIAATKKLYLDGGSNTYITEGSSDLMSFYSSGSEMFRVATTYCYTPGDFTLAAAKRLYLDGGSNSYFIESAADRIDCYAGGAVAWSSVESGNVCRTVFNYGTNAIYPAAGLGSYWQNADEYAFTAWHNGAATTSLGVAIICGTDDNSGTNTAVNILDGDGSVQGNITFSGGTVSYNAFTAGHDASLPDGEETGYAYGTLVEIVEIYYKERKDGSEMERGILYKVQKSQSAYAKNVLGAYSGQYTESVVEDDNLHQIYALGDGHIICNGENGDIEVGDGICTSSTEGEGMKADKLSMIIGIAQEDTSFSSASETKLVPVQYGLKQFQPWE